MPINDYTCACSDLEALDMPSDRRDDKRQQWIDVRKNGNAFLRCRALVMCGALINMEMPPPISVSTRQWNRDTYAWVNWLHQTAGNHSCICT